MRNPLSYYPTEDLINELKRRGLGTFNLSYIFMYKPMEEGTLTYESDPQSFNNTPHEEDKDQNNL